MTFFETLDSIMKRDPGNRGLLPLLPPSPLEDVLDSLRTCRRAVLLTGFPVRREDGSFVGETDGPSGTADLAAALTACGCQVSVVTDRASYALLKTALLFRAPQADLYLLPASETGAFIRKLIKDIAPTHAITLERPGKAADGHYHNMTGAVIDDMVADSSVFLSEAKQAGAVTISVGDGGNEMGMGAFRPQIEAGVPEGARICARDCADMPLASGVSNWWGLGTAALLSLLSGDNLLPSPETERELLSRIVDAGAVDGCTRQAALSVDALPLEVHLAVLQDVTEALQKELASCARPSSPT